MNILGNIFGFASGPFEGATPTRDGQPGLVPAPLSGEESYFLRGDGSWAPAGGGGGGDVVGPASSTDTAIARFDGTSGKTIKNSTVLLSDTGAITGITSLERDSGDIALKTTTSGSVNITAADDVNIQGLKYPDTDGSADDYLKTDGLGNLTFAALPSIDTPTNIYYVDTNGNDTTGTGRIDKPYATVQKALDIIGSAADSAEFNDVTKRYYIVEISPGVYIEDLTVPARPYLQLSLRAAVVVGNVTQDINRVLLTGGINTSKFIIKSDDLLGEHTNLTEPRNGILGNITMTSSTGANNFSALMLMNTGVSGNITFDCTNVGGYTGFLFTHNSNIGGQIATAGPSNVNINLYSNNADTPGSTGIGGTSGRINLRLVKNVNFSAPVVINSPTGGRWLNVTFANVANDFSGTTAAYVVDANSYSSYFTNVPTKGSETFTLIDKARGIDAQYTPNNYTAAALDVRSHLAGIDSGLVYTTSAWNIVTTDTQMVARVNYVANHTARLTLTLPNTIAVGAMIELVGYGSGGWRLAQGAGQTIRLGNLSTTTGSGGYIESNNASDVVRVVCVVANTNFVVASSVGNLTVI